MSQNNHCQISIPVVREENCSLPEYATKGSAGADVRAFLTEALVLEPGQRALIPTGLRFAIPENFEIQVRPRSGLALKHGITLANSPATIDSDYRGELKVILINLGQEPFTITPDMRIAQIIVSPVYQASFTLAEAEVLAETTRGSGGFGHTGSH